MNTLSPALLPESQAFELKFLVSEDVARGIARWAESAMSPDPHAEPGWHGGYAIQTLYLDTPDGAVANARPGYRATKLRVRRYGSGDLLYLEAKTKRGDRVRKRRTQVADNELGYLRHGVASSDWSGRFFLDLVLAKGLSPATLVSYRRLAYVSPTETRAARLTIDEGLSACSEDGWTVPRIASGRDLGLAGRVLELKFADVMPPKFRQLIQSFGLAPTRVSKYRSARRLLDQDPLEATCLTG